jgi:hypothetical protein
MVEVDGYKNVLRKTSKTDGLKYGASLQNLKKK